ncbi:MAG: creatininase family protein [Zestosphaera sp.]
MCELWLKTWIEVNEVCNSGKSVFLIPIGSVEQHGPHLPLGLDYMVALHVALGACRNLEKDGVRALVLPPVTYGMSSMWSAYSGTVSVSSESLYKYLRDIITSTSRNCPKTPVVVINGHAGNNDLLRVLCRDVAEETGLAIGFTSVWDLCGDVIREVFTTPFTHADEVETSLAIALNLLVGEPPKDSPEFFRKHDDFWHPLDLTKRPKAHVFRVESRETHGKGSFGRPELASREKGEALLNCMISRLVSLVKDILEDRV